MTFIVLRKRMDMEKPIELLIKKMISYYPADWGDFYSTNSQVRKLKDEMDQMCHHLFHQFENANSLSFEEQNLILNKIEEKGKMLSEIIRRSRSNKSA